MTELRDLASAQALRRLELTVTRRLEGLLHGEHIGLLPGVGSEVAEAREYRPGEDDVRRMDWAVTARTTVPHVRDLLADHELVTTIVLDASASMDFGTALYEKRDVALGAVAAFGLMTQRGGNRVGAYVSAQVPLRWPARSGRHALMGLLSRLIELPRVPAGAVGGSLAEVIRAGDSQARRRGLVVVISDFLDPDVQAWSRALRRVSARHELIAVEVVDPRELELPDVGMLALVDPESGRTRDIWTGDRRLRARYATAAAEQRALVAGGIRGSGARHLQLRTDRDWVSDIARFAIVTRRGAAYSRPTPDSARPAAVGGVR